MASLKTVLSKMCMGVLCVSLPLASSPAMAEEYTSLRAGSWEIRTTTQMIDMPVELPPVPYRAVECLTQEQLNNQENLAAVSGAQGECEIFDTKVTAQRTSWSMRCQRSGMEFNATGSISPITPETYTGTVHFTLAGGEGMPAMRGVTTLQGTWLDDCAGGQSTSGMKPVFKHGNAAN